MPIIQSKYDASCARCGVRIQAGRMVHYDPSAPPKDRVSHTTCAPSTGTSKPTTEVRNPFATRHERRLFDALRQGPLTILDIVSRHYARSERNVLHLLQMMARTSGVTIDVGGRSAKSAWTQYGGSGSKAAGLQQDRVTMTVDEALLASSSSQPSQPTLSNEEIKKAVEAALASSLTAKIDELNTKIDESIPDEDEIRAIILKAVEKIAPRTVEIKDPIGTFRPKGGYTLPACFPRLVQLASQRVHILMVGPSGCGKTFLAERLSEAIRTKAHPKGLPYYGISCSVGMSESQLSGYLLPSGKGGQFEYWSSLFVRAYTEGGLFLFDEVDASDGNTLTFLNAALANSHMFVAQRLSGQVVERHPDFVAVAAANTWGFGADDEYVGRNQLDAATLRRFSVGKVFIDYDDAVEESVTDAGILEFGRKVRQAIRAHKVRKTMSTGEMIEASKLRKAYQWSPSECFSGYFLGWTPDELRVLPEDVRSVIQTSSPQGAQGGVK